MKILFDSYKFLKETIFPAFCLSCSKEGEFLCLECALKLPRLHHQRCIACQKPSPFGKTHEDCRTRNVVDGLISALPYKHPVVSEMIETFKYKFISELGGYLAKIIFREMENQELISFFSNFTIAPVPLHQKRFNWRGFNQSEILGTNLKELLPAEIRTDLVMRIINTKPQTKLNAEGRKQNIKNAFSVINLNASKILIIDDVVTTGSTLNEIAKTLKKVGAKEVWAATVAAD